MYRVLNKLIISIFTDTKLRGLHRQKMAKKKFQMKYQHVADVDGESYSCATCVKGV